jgi:Fe-S-cluster-containing dehydrogenase component
MAKKYGMVIDLHQCVGCGACALACKNENNTESRKDGQSYNWADFIMKTEGTFPNTKYSQMPVLCNHCSAAPCVENCPVTPKAMFKADDNTTLHNQERCIGCRACQMSCPYSKEELDEASHRGETYSVISFNAHGEPVQSEWRSTEELIAGCTASPAAVAKAAGATPPDMNRYKSGDYQPVRKSGVVEKCILCHHRVTNGLQPACVDACPASARIFGDQNDPNSAISKALKKYSSTAFRYKESAGTQPNVVYVRSYNR